MSDGNKVDEFYDRMASPDPENGEATMPDDDVRDEGNVLSTPVAGGTDVTDGLERPPYWTDAMERQFRRRVSADFERFVKDVSRNGTPPAIDQCEHAYGELLDTVKDKYRELLGHDLPGTAATNVDNVIKQVTFMPAIDPLHGPGLWAKLPQHRMDEMVEARPVDLTGSPTRMDIDLMMLHTIRMGRFLTTHYTDWAQTLPACWIRHDDVVQEVYSLKCYMDLVAASPNGGFYAPTLQSLIHSALERVKEYLSSAETSNTDHKHHLSGPDERKREQARKKEYADWFNREGGWSGEPRFDPSWEYRSTDEGLDSVCDLLTPTRVEDDGVADDETLSDRSRQWRENMRMLRDSYDMDHSPERLQTARDEEERMRRVWLDYRNRERASRDNLDRAVTSASMLMRDTGRVRLLTDTERVTLSGLISKGREILREYGKNPLDEGYEPCSIDMQDDLTARLDRLVAGDPADVFNRCERMLDQIDKTFERGRETPDERRTA